MWLVATEDIAKGQEIRFDYERGERGAYWHGAPPAETVWRDARAQPPAALGGPGEGGGALSPQRSLGGGKQPPEPALHVLSTIQHATQGASIPSGSKRRAGAPFQRGDLGAQLEREIAACNPVHDGL